MKSLRARLVVIVLLVLSSAFVLVPRNFTQRSYDPASGLMRDTVVRRVPINLGLDVKGGMHLALEIDESKGVVSDCSDAMRRAERVFEPFALVMSFGIVVGTFSSIYIAAPVLLWIDEHWPRRDAPQTRLGAKRDDAPLPQLAR